MVENNSNFRVISEITPMQAVLSKQREAARVQIEMDDQKIVN
jgi:hypothetical protein